MSVPLTTCTMFLLPVCLVLGFAGLVYKVGGAFRERSLQGVWPYCVKMVVAFCALSTIAQWDPILTGMVSDASAQAGLDQTGVLTTFANDVAKKFSLQVNTSGQPATQAKPATNKPVPMGRKCRIQHSFVVFYFRISKRRCCASNRERFGKRCQTPRRVFRRRSRRFSS